MRQRSFSSSRRGFLLFEALLALMLFSIMAVGFTKALTVIRRNSMLVEERMLITELLDDTLRETLMRPVLEEGEFRSEIAEKDMEVLTLVEPMELYNEKGEDLSQMLRVVVTAYWQEDGRGKEEKVEGWRYAGLYRRR